MAKNRLADLVKDERNRAEEGERMVNGKMGFSEVPLLFLKRPPPAYGLTELIFGVYGS